MKKWFGIAADGETVVGPYDTEDKAIKMATDPPVSEPQRRAMWAAAKGHSTLGIPRSVGREFVGKDYECPTCHGHGACDTCDSKGKVEPQFGRAAGMMYVTKDGKVLMMKRADDSGWALPAGMREPGEDSETNARREAAEEMGGAPSGRARLLDRTHTLLAPDFCMDFTTYGQVVDDEFTPVLNNEHTEHAWVPLSNPPAGLHPGVSSTMKTLRSGRSAQDMTEQDWTGLVAGLLKFLGEEAGEAEHAEDAEHQITEHDREQAGILGMTPERYVQMHYHSAYHDPREQTWASWYGSNAVDAAGRATVKRVSTNEENVSKRTVTYDLYVDGKYKATYKDSLDAIKERDKINAATEAKASKGAMDKAPAFILLQKRRANYLALDRESVRTYDTDGRLHISRTPISKANVCPYYGNEIPNCEALGLDPKKVYKLFRDPEELRKAAATSNNQPLLNEHIPITADDHATDNVVGSTGTDAEFEEPYLYNSLVIWPRKDIELVEKDKKRELSSAYHYDADMTPGTYKGEPYDGVMRNIRFNHVALVKDGRAGSDVLVMDEARFTFANFVTSTRIDFSGFKPDHIAFDAFKVADAQRWKYNEMQRSMLQKQYDRGKAAKAAGKTLADNPQKHIPASPMAMAWEMGWKGDDLNFLLKTGEDAITPELWANTKGKTLGSTVRIGKLRNTARDAYNFPVGYSAEYGTGVSGEGWVVMLNGTQLRIGLFPTKARAAQAAQAHWKKQLKTGGQAGEGTTRDEDYKKVQGREARKAGKSVKDNPYPAKSDASRIWLDGFKQ